MAPVLRFIYLGSEQQHVLLSARGLLLPGRCLLLLGSGSLQSASGLLPEPAVKRSCILRNCTDNAADAALTVCGLVHAWVCPLLRWVQR
jgi:hypothetical protein